MNIKCPHCGKNINSLKYKLKSSEVGDYDLDNFYESDGYPNSSIKFYCKKCKKLICEDQGDAELFLCGSV